MFYDFISLTQFKFLLKRKSIQNRYLYVLPISMKFIEIIGRLNKYRLHYEM